MAWLSGEMDGWAVTVWMEGWVWDEWLGVLKEDDRLTDGCVEVEGVGWTDRRMFGTVLNYQFHTPRRWLGQ